jgi:hypothetical protein
MRFRTPSATRGEEAAARTAGAAEAAKLRRQQSEPMGQPPTPPSGIRKIQYHIGPNSLLRSFENESYVFLRCLNVFPPPPPL